MSDIVEQVKERYGAAAMRLGCCGGIDDAAAKTAGNVAQSIGYSLGDLARAGEGNLGLGCGNPLALASIRPGMTVLDLGSGAGFDAFLAAERVGVSGRVIGVDMTPAMLARARLNAAARGASNIEFREGRIEALPVEDASVDLVISNCVINLSPEKPQVFREVFRVLKPGGTLSVSDLVLAAPLPESVRQSVEAWVGCIAGASPIGEYLAEMFAAGFHEVALPSIRPATQMVEGLGAEGGCCGQASDAIPLADLVAAGQAIVSATFFARKPGPAD